MLSKSKIQGIYRILNTVTKDFYIGSSLNIYERFKHHKQKLNSNTHRNTRLNRAWNKYGQSKFIFEIIEETNTEHKDLRKIEQNYLDTLKPSYNVSKRADCPYLGKAHFDKMKEGVRKKCAMEWIVVNPEGVEFKIKNLRLFCLQNKLQVSLLHRVAQGHRSHHKGWKCRYANEIKFRFQKNRGHFYKVVSNGKEILIQNLNDFVIKNNLSKKKVYKILDKKIEYNGYQFFRTNKSMRS